MTDCHGVRSTVSLASDRLSWRCFHENMFILKIMVRIFFIFSCCNADSLKLQGMSSFLKPSGKKIFLSILFYICCPWYSSIKHNFNDSVLSPSLHPPCILTYRLYIPGGQILHFFFLMRGLSLSHSRGPPPQMAYSLVANLPPSSYSQPTWGPLNSMI